MYYILIISPLITMPNFLFWWHYYLPGFCSQICFTSIIFSQEFNKWGYGFIYKQSHIIFLDNIAPLCSGTGFHYIGIRLSLTSHRCLLIFLSGCSNNSFFSRFKSSNKICPTIKNYIFISPGTWYNIAIWKCRFIFQGKFLLFYLCIFCSHVGLLHQECQLS